MKNRITQYKISNLPFKEQLYSGGGVGGQQFSPTEYTGI